MERTSMWVGHATGRVLVAAAALVVAVGGVVYVLDSALAALVCLVAAAVVAAFSRITVMVDQRGLTVLYSHLRWPRTVVPLEEVVRVDAVSLSPMKWGGWGYRGSRKAFGRAAVVLRSGPGLKVEIADGTTFSVSVDDPAGAVELLETLIAQRR